MEPLSIFLLVGWTITAAAWWQATTEASRWWREMMAQRRYIASLEQYIYTIESRATFVGPEEEHRKELRERFRSE